MTPNVIYGLAAVPFAVAIAILVVGTNEETRQVVLAALIAGLGPCAVVLLGLFVQSLMEVRRESVEKIPRLKRQPCVEEKNGWRIEMKDAPTGILLGAWMTDHGFDSDGRRREWPTDAKWVVVDAAGFRYTAGVDLDPAPSPRPWPRQTRKTWPGDFGGELEGGPHKVAWVVEGVNVVSCCMSLRIEKSSLRPLP
ncbi:MAG TPA: hypothetical protein VHJ34_00105 [Actinomycetota bacterium]|nr:hypothetical protein [Actinomycetota bacterium]